MKSKLTALPVLLALCLFVGAPEAKATIITLTEDGCTGTCGTGPFGTVQLIQTTSSLVTVTLTLAANERFAGTGAGEALTFNILGAPVTIGNISAGFELGPAPASASTFGSFLYSVSCSLCQGGQAGNTAGPLSFTVTRAGGVVIADFTPNDKGVLFAADIVGNNGKTGNVAAVGGGFDSNGSPVPEPISISLLGGGLLAIWLRKAAQKQS